MSSYDQNNIGNQLVNYTSILTSAANEFYDTQTGADDSLAFLIKNNTIVKFDLILNPEPNGETDTKGGASLSVVRAY